MRKANAQRISNRFALSLDASCFCAELAAAVVLPVQAVLLRKLQAAQVAVVLLKSEGRCFTPNSASNSCPMALMRAASLWGLMDRVVVNQSKPLSRAYCARGASAAGSRRCSGCRAPALFPARLRRCRTAAGRKCPPPRSPPAGGLPPRTFAAPRPGGSTLPPAMCWGYSTAP